MSTATAQPELPDMPRVRVREGLVGVQTFGEGFTPDGPLIPAEVLLRIENGAHKEHIAWAFNIASKHAEDREVRVLYPLVAPTWRLALPGKGEHEFALVLNLIFPPQKHVTRSAMIPAKDRHLTQNDVWRAWRCHTSHIAQLIAEGELTIYRPREVKSGPNGSASITWQSVTEFLQRRCLQLNQGKLNE